MLGKVDESPPGSPRRQPCGDCWIDTARVVNTHLCQSSRKYLTPCLNLACSKGWEDFSVIASNILFSADSEYLELSHLCIGAPRFCESSPFTISPRCFFEAEQVPIDVTCNIAPTAIRWQPRSKGSKCPPRGQDGFGKKDREQLRWRLIRFNMLTVTIFKE